MKKIIFASAAALCAAVGLSSFKTATKAFTPNYYFLVKTGIGASGLTSYINSQVTYEGTTAPSGLCSGTGSNHCIVRFNNTQVTLVSPGVYKLYTTISSQAYTSLIQTRQPS